MSPVHIGSIHGYDVFLGGSCNPTTWRKDLAVPYLQEAGVSFYNPVRSNLCITILDPRINIISDIPGKSILLVLLPTRLFPSYLGLVGNLGPSTSTSPNLSHIIHAHTPAVFIITRDSFSHYSFNVRFRNRSCCFRILSSHNVTKPST